MKVALHACCGPCLIEPLDDLVRCNDVVVVYANPNIAPAEEYVRRRDTMLAYAESVGAEAVEIPYEPALWREAVAGLESDKATRCAACYRVRLRLTAEYATSQGADALATTLTVSPHQDAEAIREAGEQVAAESGLEYLHRDYRELYPQASRRSRELEMYRQNYCGCLCSKDEADNERAERRAQRAAEKARRVANGRGGGDAAVTTAVPAGKGR